MERRGKASISPEYLLISPSMPEHSACPGCCPTCHSQMERVVPAALVLLLCKQAVGGDHDQRVGRLHAEQEVVEVMLAADLGELEGALDHAPARAVMD